MPIITGREQVLQVYAEAAKRGWVLPCLCTENLTTTEAVLTAAEEFALEKGYETVPVILAITNQYDHRSQSANYTCTRRWDVGLELFRTSVDVLEKEFPHVQILIHLDHTQHDRDAQLLESDLSRFSSVMYDASALPLEENIRKTADYVRRKGQQIVIEGACDEIVDASGNAECAITDADKCADYMARTGVDIVVANLGTEHRASAKDLQYHADAAKAIKEKIGPRICLHGTSSVSNDQIKKLFEDGICKVNIWTAIERDATPALLEFMVKNAAKCAGAKMEERLVEEGCLTKESKTGEPASLQYFTSTARTQIVFEEMKKIVRSYLDLWYV